MSQTAVEAVEGRAWVFPDININTDLIMPSDAFRLPPAEQHTLLFRSYRPGWVDEVQPGDILVAGKNFGTGSGRPGAALMRTLGVVALVADSINDLFYRNCVNAALLPLECPGASAAVREGDTIRVDVRAGTLTNVATGESLEGTPVPELLLEIIAAGGLLARLTAGGYLDTPE
jgi:3-isopropylmalate/(R)-2-methylmalate dehydratase small subunit